MDGHGVSTWPRARRVSETTVCERGGSSVGVQPLDRFAVPVAAVDDELGGLPLAAEVSSRARPSGSSSRWPLAALETPQATMTWFSSTATWAS